MAINPETEYAGKIEPSSAEYPFGKAQNITVPGDGTGTPLVASLVNDLFGLQQALLIAAGIVPSGSSDQVGASQYLQSIIEIASGRAFNYDESGVVDEYVLDPRADQEAPASYFDGMMVKFTTANENTGEATVNVAALGVKDIVLPGGTALAAKDISGETVLFFDSANDRFELLNAKISGQLIPASTLAKAVANLTAVEGQIVQITDRANAQFQYLTGQTPNTFNIVAADASGLDLRLIIEDTADVEQFGAVRASNPSAAIQAAADFCKTNGTKLYARRGSAAYDIDTALDLKKVLWIEFLEDINTSAVTGEIAVFTGGFSESGNPDHKFAAITDGSSLALGPTPAQPVHRLAGSKSGRFEYASCNYFQVYSDEAQVANGEKSNAYNKFYLTGVMRRAELTSATGFSWITENDFYGGRIKELYITDGGDYKHNGNKFYNNTFEGSDVDIQFNGAHSNKIYGARCENISGSTGVAFDAESYNNNLQITWGGSDVPRTSFINAIPISDSGQGNIVYTENQTVFKDVLIASVSRDSMVGNGTDAKSFDPNICPATTFKGISGGAEVSIGHKGLTSIVGTRWIYISEMIEVELGDSFLLEGEFEGNILAPHFFVYDENQQPLTTEGGGGVYFNMPSFTFNAGREAYVASSLNSNTRTGSVVRTELKYIKFGFFVTPGNIFRSVNLRGFLKRLERPTSAANSKQFGTIISLDGPPTQTFLNDSLLIHDHNANAFYRIAYSAEFFLSVTAAASATTLTFTSTTNMVNGDQLGLLLDNDTTHWSAISGLTATTVTVDALPSQATLGARCDLKRFTLLV